MREKLIRFIKNKYLVGKSIVVNDTDSFIELGIIDSVGILELIEFIENEFNICITETEMISANFDSVEKIIEFIERK